MTVAHRVYAKTDLLNQYTQRLIKLHGIKRIGKGAFADVFLHPTLPNVAVRVSDMVDANNDWLLLSKRMKNNPWMPTVFETCTAKVERPGGHGHLKFFLAFVERLKPVPSLSGINPVLKHIVEAIEFDYDAELPILEAHRTKIGLLLEEFHDPMLSQAIDLVYKGPARSAHLDLGPRNWLRRGSQLVINDPWYFV